jgi:hypothetical protein
MDKIFGGLDFVEEGEIDGSSEKREAMAMVKEEEKAPSTHVENTSQGLVSEPRDLRSEYEQASKPKSRVASSTLPREN